jgi:predicted small secreted protein
MKRKLLPLFLLTSVLLGLFSAGCRTMNGAGQDIERAGEKIQENAKNH